jgi:hypothetical protein
VPAPCRMRASDRDLIRGGHYGQRSCEPHLQAEHMAAPINAGKREERPCQLGAVHTWHKARKQRFGSPRPAFVSSMHVLLQAAAVRFMKARHCSSECATFTSRPNMWVCNSDIT